MVSEWTSNDVPSVSSLYLYNRRPDLGLDGKRFGAAAALEAVVAHLNAHHPKPPRGGHDAQIAQLVRMCIEAAQAVDPVEEKARELYRVATPDARWETVADEYRRIARHVLGQEDAR